MRRRGFFMMMAAWLAGRARAAVEYPRVEAGRALVFPRDHGAHPAYRTEWWYLTGWLDDAVGVQVFDNVFWGQKQGAYGGLSIGQNVKGLDLVNNVVLSVNYTHIGGSYDPAEHHGDYNFFGTSLGQWQDGAHDKVGADPGFTAIPDQSGAKVNDPTPDMFVPKAGSPLIDSGTTR